MGHLDVRGTSLPAQSLLWLSWIVLFVVSRAGKRSFDELNRGSWERCTKKEKRENVFISLAAGNEVTYEITFTFSNDMEYDPPSSGRAWVGTGTECLIPLVNKESCLN
jgi:hypothetical protein